MKEYSLEHVKNLVSKQFCSIGSCRYCFLNLNARPREFDRLSCAEYYAHKHNMKIKKDYSINVYDGDTMEPISCGLCYEYKEVELRQDSETKEYMLGQGDMEQIVSKEFAMAFIAEFGDKHEH